MQFPCKRAIWDRLLKAPKSLSSVLRLHLHNVFKARNIICPLTMADAQTPSHRLNHNSNPEEKAALLIEPSPDELDSDEEEYDLIFSDDGDHEFEEPASAQKMSGRTCARRTTHADLVQITVPLTAECRRNRWPRLRRKGHFAKVREPETASSSGGSSDETPGLVSVSSSEPTSSASALMSTIANGEEYEWQMDYLLDVEEWCTEDVADETRLGLPSPIEERSPSPKTIVSALESSAEEAAGPDHIEVTPDSFDAGHQENGVTDDKRTRTSSAGAEPLSPGLFLPPPLGKSSFEIW